MRVPNLLQCLAGALATMVLAACGSGGKAPDPPPPNTWTGCPTAAACGDVIVAMTDADGDFLSYTVDVQSLTLKRADGTTVEALPVTTRVDFAQVVDLTEVLTSATVPNGAYVEGTLRLDYSNAAVTVESNGQPIAAKVVGADGNALGAVDVRVMLDNRNHLTVASGLTSLLTLDFDLAASNTVDLTTSPATVTATPSLVASLEPVEEKTLRLRGPLVNADTTTGSYVIDVRPFNHQSARLGEVTVHTNPTTMFEVNGTVMTGAAGLQALATAGAGTPSIAFGTLTRADHRFDAQIVFGGTSVPGAGIDTVVGTVLSRSGSDLVVRGGTIVRNADGSANFVRDEIRVRVGDSTKVFRNAVRPATQLGPEAVSVGQQIQAFGSATQKNGEWVLDATQGRVRLHLTRLLGSVKQVGPGALTLNLASIDGREASVFNFAGTGTSAAQDADPANYVVSTGPLDNLAIASGQPARVFGFVTPFGAAAPDFEGRTVVDVRDRGSLSTISWGRSGTAAPFASADQTGLVLNLQNPDIGDRHHIRTGWQFTDLLALPAAPQIAPVAEGAVFVIVSASSCMAFHDFAEFVTELNKRVSATSSMKSLTAHGTYDSNANVFSAGSIVAIL